MKGWPYGKALSQDKRSIRYFSPSALMAADPGTSEGCPRRYWYEYRGGLKPEEQSWQTLGRQLHAENEHYLLTGERTMGSLALAGLHMLPKPKTEDPRILIEHDIGGGSLETAPVRASGIPVVGFIDCIHWQGTNAGTNDITEALDPPGTVEVIDWKTTSDPKWIKTANEVSRTLQMTTYGKWAITVKDAEWVRLSHGYYVTKGRHTPRKVSLRVHKDQINERWEYVEKLASSLTEIVKEDNPDNVQANTRACKAFRGCPHANYCSAASHNSLASIIGSEMAASLLGIAKPGESVLTLPTTDELSQNPGNQQMSLLAKLQAAAKPEVKGGMDVQSEMARLLLEEIDQKYPGATRQLKDLEACGLGMPKFKGEAARAYAAYKGTPVPADGITPGSGELAEFEFEYPSQFSPLLAEAEGIVRDRRKAGELPPSNPFPDDAPPALASPEEKPEHKIVTAQDAIEAVAQEPKEKKKRGRPAKVKEPEVEPLVTVVDTSYGPQVVTVGDVLTEVIAEPAQASGATMPVAAAPEVGGINLYVDCIPSCGFQSFWPFVNEITNAMAREFKGTDYRTTDPNGELGYGRWKGVLAAGLRAMYEAGRIPAGNYVLDNALTETGSVVTEAMREVVARSGGVLVRGIR